MSATQCIAYIAVVDIITSIWVYYGAKKGLSFSTLAYAMFLPTVAALCFCGNVGNFLSRVVGLEYPLGAVVFSGVAVYGVAVQVGACVVLDLLMGWARFNPEPSSAIHGHNENFLSGFLRASGEEIGWRCFLLPFLMEYFSPWAALLISGVAWGLFHVPILILMTSRLSPPRPVLTIFIQFLAITLAAFPHGWVAIKSGYCVWASGMMHAVWNKVNPILLGSIYTQTPGMLKGEQWLINGEGLAGCLVTLPLALWMSFTM